MKNIFRENLHNLYICNIVSSDGESDRKVVKTKISPYFAENLASRHFQWEPRTWCWLQWKDNELEKESLILSVIKSVLIFQRLWIHPENNKPGSWSHFCVAQKGPDVRKLYKRWLFLSVSALLVVVAWTQSGKISFLTISTLMLVDITFLMT